MNDPGNQGKDDIADAFGMDGHNVTGNDYGGEHHSVYNDVMHASWDDDRNGNYVEGSYHETPAPGTEGTHYWNDRD